jgi:hypothetical protein
MRAFVVAVALLFALDSAYAQPNFGDGKKKEDEALAAKRRVEEDAAYKSSLQRIPTKDPGVDPWGSARALPGEGNASQGKQKKQ